GGGGVVHVDVPAAGGRQADGERHRRRAAVALDDGGVGDRDRRQGVVVHDGAGGDGPGQGGAADVPQGQAERLIALVERVAVNRHGDGHRGLAGRDGGRARSVRVVAAGQGRAVGRVVTEGDRRRAGLRQADDEVRRSRAGVALGDRGVGHAQADVVVEDRAGGGRTGEGGVGRVGEGDGERLVGF